MVRTERLGLSGLFLHRLRWGLTDVICLTDVVCLADIMKGHMKICSENQVINKEGVSKRRIFINLSMPFMAYLKYHLITI